MVRPTAFAWIHLLRDRRDSRVALHPVSHEAGTAERGRNEHAGQQRAQDPAHGMHAEHVERVVDLQHVLEAVDAPQADDARGEADHERAGDAHVARGRRDRDEARDRTRRRTEHRRLALEDPFAERPRQHRARRREVRVEERQRRRVARFERGARVEAEPAEPQQRGAHHRQRQVARRHRFLAEADALADHVGADEARDTRVDVHDGAAREVERAPSAR